MNFIAIFSFFSLFKIKPSIPEFLWTGIAPIEFKISNSFSFLFLYFSIPLFSNLDSVFIGLLILSFAIFIASSEESIPIYFLFNSSDATNVVPLPQKGSNTISPSSVAICIIFSNNNIGFWVGYPTLSFALGFKNGISHTSESGTPFFSFSVITFPSSSVL